MNFVPWLRKNKGTAALLLALWGWHVLLLTTWLHRDQRPLQWDDAVHASTAWDYKEAARSFSLFDLLRTPPRPGHPPYPPLVHYGIASFLAVSQGIGVPMEDAATWVNLVFIGILILGAWLLASTWWGNTAGLCAAVLVSLAPPVLMHSRDILVDVALASWVVMTYALWMKSAAFTKRKITFLLGLVFAGGLLTKWTFPVYVLPVLAAAVRAAAKPKDDSIRRSLLYGAGVAFILAAPWYAVNAFTVLPRLIGVASQGSLEGDPAVLSLSSWVWYLKLLPQQLSWPGLLLCLGGVAWIFYRRLPGRGRLAVWFFVGYLVWSAVSNKNDRYFLPVLLVLPLSASALPYRIPQASALAAVLFSAWFTWGPAGSAFALPPAAQSWPLEEIISAAAQDRDPAAPFSILTVVSNHQYLNGNNLRWTAQKTGVLDKIVPRTKLQSLGRLSEFVLVKTGDLGPVYSIGRTLSAREEIFQPDGWFTRSFDVRRRWSLPDGSEAILYRRREPEASREGGLSMETVASLAADAELRRFSMDVEPSARRGGEYACRLRAGQVSFGGITLRDVDVTLDGAQTGKDDQGKTRLLRLRRVHVSSARFFESDAAAFFRTKIKNLEDASVVFLSDRRIALSGRAAGIPLYAEVAVRYSSEREFPILSGRILKLKAAGLPLPVFLLGPRRTVALELKPHPGLPFELTLAGLEVVPSRAGGEGALVITQNQKEGRENR
ncbi:MAG TPA: glycosyltransferase family 39 protein [Elusimicrobiota bacterium]|nr:glycosyltransferase family 39 protein [Elusimicrobiota bacterium]